MNRKLAFYISILGFIGVIVSMTGTAINSLQYPFLSALGTLRFFTIQSNLIIGVTFMMHAFLNSSTSKKLVGGSVVYITITFLGFFIMLEKTWDPVGVALAGSIINHYIVPALSLLYVITFRDDFKFKLNNIKEWITYPFSYLIFLIIFGLFSGDYIYPFLDLTNISILAFIITVIFIVGIFIAVSYLLILLTNKKEAS